MAAFNPHVLLQGLDSPQLKQLQAAITQQLKAVALDEIARVAQTHHLSLDDVLAACREHDELGESINLGNAVDLALAQEEEEFDSRHAPPMQGSARHRGG